MKRTEWVAEWKYEQFGIVRVDYSDDEYDNLYTDKPSYCQSCDGDAYSVCTDGCPLVN